MPRRSRPPRKSRPSAPARKKSAPGKGASRRSGAGANKAVRRKPAKRLALRDDPRVQSAVPRDPAARAPRRAAPTFDPTSAAPVAAQDATSETTTPAACPHFGPCGGCSWLHLDYHEELRRKQDAVRAAVAETPSIADARVEPIVAATAPLFYRTSLKVPFGATPGGAVCGFYQRGSHKIVDVHTCLIQHPVLTELLRVTRELVNSQRVPVYHEHVHRGILRHLIARVAAGTGEVLAGLVVRRAGSPQIKRLAWTLYERLRERGLVGVVENENPEQTNVILGPRTQRIVGRSVMFEEADGLRLRTSLQSFAQVNAAQASRLFAEVAALMPVGDGIRVVDLYSGYGAIGLRLAAAGARVIAVERNRVATRDGSDIARANELQERIRFVTGDAGHGLAIAAEEGPIDALVVDPPRRGLTDEVVDRLRAAALPRIVYVSCNPESLLRDLDRLAPTYRTCSLRPVDLFPRTDHVEVVALLEPRR